MADAISKYLRDHVQEIIDAWEQEILVRAPELRRLSHGVIVDHMPELLQALAHWVDNDVVAARRGFDALASGHALTREGHGIELRTLTEEYRCLRNVLVGRMLEIEPLTQELRSSIMRMHDGLDIAVADSIRRFTEAREELRDRFIGILGHDLRNPLNAVILGAAQVASRPCNEPRHARVASAIQRSSDRMMRMISDIIDFAQAHLGEGIPAVPAPCDMGEICEDAVQELALAYPDRNISVETGGDLRGAWDRDRVTQAISNLIGNALQYGEDPIVVSATGGPEEVVTRISNTGKPIPPDRLPRLFEAFERMGGDPTRAQGLGLGLYIVQQIALAHGGMCEVTSDEKATVFEITWPRVPLAVAPHR